MKLQRKHAWILIGIAVWNAVTYAQFTNALIHSDEDRPAGYYVAHTILIIVNLAIAILLATWGYRALKGRRAP